MTFVKRNPRLVALGALLALLLPAAATWALARPMTELVAKSVTIGTTVERITFETGITTGFDSCLIWNNSTTTLYVGGSDVDGTDGFPICTNTSNCPDSKVTVDATSAYALSSSGNLTVKILCGR